MTDFGKALENVQSLPPEEQEDLVGIVQKQLLEQRRAEIDAAIEEAQTEYKAGNCLPVSVDEIMNEALD